MKLRKGTGTASVFESLRQCGSSLVQGVAADKDPGSEDVGTLADTGNRHTSLER